jgi:hypothetical protein
MDEILTPSVWLGVCATSVIGAQAVINLVGTERFLEGHYYLVYEALFIPLCFGLLAVYRLYSRERVALTFGFVSFGLAIGYVASVLAYAFLLVLDGHLTQAIAASALGLAVVPFVLLGWLVGLASALLVAFVVNHLNKATDLWFVALGFFAASLLFAEAVHWIIVWHVI